MKEDNQQTIWDSIAEKMLLEFAKCGCPIIRATTSLSWGFLKGKRHGKLSIHFATVQETIETAFRIISENQFHSVRNSRRDVWRIRISSRKNGATCCDGAINRAQCNQDRIFFGKWWPCISKFSNNWSQFTTKKNLVNSAWMQNFWMFWRMDSVTWRKTLEIQHNSIQWLVVNTLFQSINITTEKMDPRKHPKIVAQ